MNAQASTPQLYDVEIEQALIGACLVDDVVARESEGLVDAAEFMDPLHQRVWSSIHALRARGGAATPITVHAHLASDEGLIELGGRAYLVSLARGASPSPNFKDYARIIRDLAQRRRIDAELEAARSRIYAFDIPVTQCVADVIAAAGLAAENESREAGYLPLAEAIDEVMREAEAAVNGTVPESVKTGLTDLDEIIGGGLQSGDMVVIAGRPGQGKTVALGKFGLAAARDGRPAIIFELEMRRRSILHRLFCDIDFDHAYKKPLAYARMRSGKFYDGEFERMEAAAGDLRRLPVSIFDTAGMTITQIGSHAQRFADRSRRMGVIVIDYLQIVKSGERYSGSKVAEMTEVSNEIKRMAKRIGWPVAVGCQLNREVEKREVPRPQLSDLRETGAIEQDADIVIGMHRPAYYVARKKPVKGKEDPKWVEWLADMETTRNVLELGVIKNRSGPESDVKCFVDIGASAIRDHDWATRADPGQGMLV